MSDKEVKRKEIEGYFSEESKPPDFDYMFNKKEIKHQSLSSRLLKKIKYIVPSIRFDTHSKRHMTIVILMVLTLLGMFYIAYRQGIFN